MSSKYTPKERVRPLTHLILVESIEKAGSVQAALAKGGMTDFFVLPIGEKLFDMPGSKVFAGINHSLDEVGRFIVAPEAVQNVKNWALGAFRVLVATDADHAGDVLALDVAILLNDHKNIGRVRLRALDAESVILAFANVEQIRAKDTWPDLTRRLLDRLIVCAYPGLKDRAGTDLVIDRTTSGVIGCALLGARPFAEVTLAIPADDGGDAFVCHLPVFHYNYADIQVLVERCNEFCASGGVLTIGKSVPAPIARPWNYGQAILNISRISGKSVSIVDESLGSLYRSGKISYPYSKSDSLSGDGVSVIMAIAAKKGMNFDPKRVPVFTRGGRHAHEAPRPMTDVVDVGTPMSLLTDTEVALSLTVRNLLCSGVPFSKHTPDTDGLPAWARKLKFSRTVCNRLQPWPRRQPETGMRRIPLDESILSILFESDISRPSMWSENIETVVAEKLFDEKMRLTDRALDLVNVTPGMLLKPDTTSSIDSLIDKYSEKIESGEPPQKGVQRMLEYLGIWDVAAKALESEKSESYQLHGLTGG